METIFQSEKIPVTCRANVLVVGGGIAGIAAALSAARELNAAEKTKNDGGSGENKRIRVLLAEKQYMLGGLATAGLVTIYLPLCDGQGKQVSFSIAEELLRFSLPLWHNTARGYNDWIARPETEHTSRSPRFEADFNPQVFALAAEKLLEENDVEIFYGATLCGVQKRGDTITHAIFESKSESRFGKFAVETKTIVDASGDLDAGNAAGANVKLYDHGNVPAAWYYSSSAAAPYALHTLGLAETPEEMAGETPQPERLSSKRINGVNGKEISDFMRIAHSAILKDYLEKRKETEDFQIATIATIPQIRMSRALATKKPLNIAENHVRQSDSVGLIADWRKRGVVLEVPFGALHSESAKNLICAGRCVAVADDNTWDMARVIPCCAVTGEAAGLAAAMLGESEKADGFAELNIEALQAKLKARGVKLHED